MVERTLLDANSLLYPSVDEHGSAVGAFHSTTHRRGPHLEPSYGAGPHLRRHRHGPPQQTTTYTVTATGVTTGCAPATAQVTVTVNGSPEPVADAATDQLHVASNFSAATGRGYVLASRTRVRAYEVDGDGVARTGLYQHADGTRFKLSQQQVRVSHVQAPIRLPCYRSDSRLMQPHL